MTRNFRATDFGAWSKTSNADEDPLDRGPLREKPGAAPDENTSVNDSRLRDKQKPKILPMTLRMLVCALLTTLFSLDTGRLSIPPLLPLVSANDIKKC